MELNWENARLWEANANEKKGIHNEPKWKWDCGFKLDFDGFQLVVGFIRHIKTLAISGKEQSKCISLMMKF